MPSERIVFALDREEAIALDTKRRLAGYSTVADYMRELARKDLSASPEHAVVSAARTAALNETRQWAFNRLRQLFAELAKTMQSGAA